MTAAGWNSLINSASARSAEPTTLFVLETTPVVPVVPIWNALSLASAMLAPASMVRVALAITLEPTVILPVARLWLF